MLKKVGGSVEETLFIEKSDPVMEKWVGKTVSNEEAEKISGIKKVVYLDSFEKQCQMYFYRKCETSIFRFRTS